ncbi:MAG: HEPN domain-containing protein [Candidatus Aminicenantes bacterium]|nr:HEPN domain-containing protein [Candidatus Aminicenantes bacterium]
MDIEKKIEYWKKSAEHDLDTAESLFKAKKFDWALFLGHLVLEKMLKALYIKKKETFPPKTHNLLFLAKEAKIQLEDADTDFFEEVNTFNISTRYPDEQFKFYQLCTEEFTEEKLRKIKEKYQWLKKKMA